MGGAPQGMQPARSSVSGYVVSVAATAVATLLKLLFPEALGRDAPVAVYLGAVMVAAWYGGTGPGLSTTALSVLAGAYLFAAPYGSFRVADVNDLVRIFVGALEGVIISGFAGALRRATLTARERTEELALANDGLRDEIDARKKAESSLQRTTDRLRHAEKMKGMGILAGGIAHDFNNLLSVILNYSTVILSRLPADDPLRVHVKELGDAAGCAANVARGLLAFSRKGVVEPRQLDLRETVRGLEGVLRVMIGDQIELIMRFDATLAPIEADPTQMEQLVTNLAVNARDAMARGGKLTIELSDVAMSDEESRGKGIPAGPYVRLTVADTGAGIPEEIRPRIFEPLFTTKEAGHGSGLGLAIVHGVVEASGGVIAVESTLGVGTTFTLHFPRAAGPARDGPPSTRSIRGVGVDAQANERS
jgi:signal transduction histidine kinase